MSGTHAATVIRPWQPDTKPSGAHAAERITGRHAADVEFVEPFRLHDASSPSNTGPLRLRSIHNGRPLLSAGLAATTGAIVLIAGLATIKQANTPEPATSSPDNTGPRTIISDGISADLYAVLTNPEPTVATEQGAAPVSPSKAAAPAPVNEVTVKAGDTVGSIAATYGKNVVDVLAANGLGAFTVIEAGQVLILDGPPKAVPAAPAPVQTIATESATPPPAAPAQNLDRAQRIVSAALGQVGETQDCVKMVADALAAVGIYWYKWPVEYYGIGHAVPASQAMPGDLIYYVGGSGPGTAAHIAIYIGNGQAVHGGWNGNQTIVFSANVGTGPNFIRLN